MSTMEAAEVDRGVTLWVPFAVQGQRVRDIQFLQKELETKLGETIVEMDLLLASQSREARALEACQEPLRITVVCLEERLVPGRDGEEEEDVFHFAFI